MKQYNTREIIAILKSNGYTLSRKTKSSHKVYSDGVHTISIPINSKPVNKMIFERLVKENNLKIN